MGDVVTLLGARYHDDVLALYQQADLFILSSVAEGMPIVLMESMLSGVPVIAPSLSGIPELLDQGNAGFLYPTGSVDAMVSAIRQALDEPALTERRRQAALTHIEERFNSQRNTDQFAATLRTL